MGSAGECERCGSPWTVRGTGHARSLDCRVCGSKRFAPEHLVALGRVIVPVPQHALLTRLPFTAHPERGAALARTPTGTAVCGCGASFGYRVLDVSSDRASGLVEIWLVDGAMRPWAEVL